MVHKRELLALLELLINVQLGDIHIREQIFSCVCKLLHSWRIPFLIMIQKEHLAKKPCKIHVFLQNLKKNAN